MAGACEAGEVFLLLESGAAGWAEAAAAVGALWGAVREPWLVRALLQYHARTGSQRALGLLARAPEPHARHLLDALAEQLQAPGARRQALAALAPLVARRPAWLPRLLTHPLPRELLRAARLEREPLALLHALLALAALVPAAPALAAPHWPDMADALLRPAALTPPPPPAVAAHLALAQLALFHALYATHPCTLLHTLRAELAAGAGGAARDAVARSLQPLLASVRLHPALVTGSREREAEAARRLEEHEVVAETRRLALQSPPPAPRAPPAAAPAPAPPPPPPAPPTAVADLRPGTEPWFALAERCGADSAPHTPLPADADADAAEPPEAAVEATPENTPAKETRAAFRFPSESGAVRAIGRRAVSARAASPPAARRDASPPVAAEGGGGGGGGGGRLARVLAERRALDSPVLFAAGGGVPPAGALRVEARPPAPAAPSPGPAPAACAEDCEVVALTTRWAEEGGAPAPRPLALRPPPTRRAARPSGRPPRRATSLAPRGARTASVACQTLDTWPEPYEFLIADFYRNIPDDAQKRAEGGEPAQPCERLDAYLSALYAGAAPPGAAPGAGAAELGEQLALTHAQLMYERWRREAHAERNRRLLGRCRAARALELHNAALQERLRAAHRDAAELRARRAAQAPPAPAPPALDDERLARLEDALQDERAARARADARRQEADAARAQALAELQRARGQAFEAERHVEALARAALAAEQRGEHVKRLRCELLVLAEREARLSAAARAPDASAANAPAPAPAPLERALRAALARAESEAAAACARADVLSARAHELEAALAARDQALAEVRRAARAGAEEGAARAGALQQRHDALLRVLRAAEGRHLELLAARAPPRAHPAPSPPPPPTTPPAPDS